MHERDSGDEREHPEEPCNRRVRPEEFLRADCSAGVGENCPAHVHCHDEECQEAEDGVGRDRKSILCLEADCRPDHVCDEGEGKHHHHPEPKDALQPVGKDCSGVEYERDEEEPFTAHDLRSHRRLRPAELEELLEVRILSRDREFSCTCLWDERVGHADDERDCVVEHRIDAREAKAVAILAFHGAR